MSRSTAAGAFWIANGQIARIVLSTLTVLTLARFVSPEAFGIIAIVIAVALVANALGDFGLGAALVAGESPDEAMLCTAFWINIAFSSALGAVVVLVAPWMETLLATPGLTAPLQVSSLIFVLTSARSVHRALLERDLAFGRIASAEVFGTFAGCAVAVVLAVMGQEVWALVFQQLGFAGGATAAYAWHSGWRPKARWSLGRALNLARFGWQVTASQVVSVGLRNLDRPIISRGVGAEALGYYAAAFQIIDYPMRNISLVVRRVAFPTLSTMRDATERLREMQVTALHGVSMIVLPLVFGVMSVADEFVAVALGPDWAPAAIVVVFLAPSGGIYALNGANASLLLARGRTGLLLKLNILSSMMLVVAMLIGAQEGLLGVAAARLASELIYMPILWGLTFREIGLSPLKVARTLAPVAMSCAAMVAAVRLLSWELPEDWTDLPRLAVLVAAGAAVYITLELILDRRRLLEMRAKLARRD